MKKNDIISIIQDNDISEYYSLKNLGIEGYAFPYQEALKIVQICKLLVIPILKIQDTQITPGWFFLL